MNSSFHEKFQKIIIEIKKNNTLEFDVFYEKLIAETIKSTIIGTIPEKR